LEAWAAAAAAAGVPAFVALTADWQGQLQLQPAQQQRQDKYTQQGTANVHTHSAAQGMYFAYLYCTQKCTGHKLQQHIICIDGGLPRNDSVNHLLLIHQVGNLKRNIANGYRCL
jgi:hypothetical protein